MPCQLFRLLVATSLLSATALNAPSSSLASEHPGHRTLAADSSKRRIAIIDKRGKVEWEYKVPLFDKKERGGHGLNAFGNKTFCALRLENGNTLISTGNGHSVLEVTPKKKIIWQIHQDDLPDIQLAWVTTLVVLPSGNIVIGNCHAGPDNPRLVEVTRDKEVVWTYKNLKLFGNSLSNSTILDVPGTLR